MMFLLGFASAMAYLCASGLVADRLAHREIDGSMGGGEFLFCVLAWPIGMLRLAVRKVWR